MRERPVATPKIAVERDEPAALAERVRARWADPPRDAPDVTTDGSPRKSIGRGPVCYDRVLLPSVGPLSGLFLRMPNIRQQKKRVRSAARQRLENLRYRSTVKTLTRRLGKRSRTATQEKVAAEHRELVRCIDKAAREGALHRNTAARKKAQAARLVSGVRLASSALSRRLGRVTSTSVRVELELVRQPAPPLTAGSRSARRTVAERSSSRSQCSA